MRGHLTPSPVGSRSGQARYRARQFLGALGAQVDPVERAALLQAAHLPPALAALFVRMPRPYQWHALNVAQRVQGAGDPILLQAALLHDIGKWDPVSGRRVTLLVRVVTVLAHHLPGGSGLLHRLSGGPPSPRSPRYPWYLQAQHARLGAALAAQGGAPAEVVALIRHHEAPAPPLSPAQRTRLRTLQAADDAA